MSDATLQTGSADSGVVWTVLGAGAILPRRGYGCSGYALRPGPGAALTLFDCGPGTLRSLGEAGMALTDVRRVVLSHFHPDHCLDVLALAFARRNPGFEARRDAPSLELVGPLGLVEWLARAGDLYGSRGWLRFDAAVVLEVDPAGSGALELDDLTLRWAPTKHTPNALAWRADVPIPGATGAADPVRRVSVAYTGDTGENPDVAELARGVDLFVAECSFPDELATEHHLTPSSAARLAREAGVGRLLLTHFYPVLDPDAALAVAARTFSGAIELARDRSTHAVGRIAP